MSELTKIIGAIVMTLIYAYMMLSNHPEIVKYRNTTQKYVYTGVWLVSVYFWISH